MDQKSNIKVCKRFFFVFLRHRSCAFVDRFLIVSEKKDPPNHTKKITRITRKGGQKFDKDFSHAFLSDFGMSRYFAITERVTSFVTAEGGSSAYVSPEQIMYDKQSSSSDIYSFAI